MHLDEVEIHIYLLLYCILYIKYGISKWARRALKYVAQGHFNSLHYHCQDRTWSSDSEACPLSKSLDYKSKLEH